MLILLTFGGGFLLYLYYLFDQHGFNSNMYNIYFATVNTYHYYAIRAEEVLEYYNNLVIQDQVFYQEQKILQKHHWGK